MKEVPSPKRKVTVTMDYGEYMYHNDFCNVWFVEFGNKTLSGCAKFPVKPTKKQLRKAKNSWIKCMREWDYKTAIAFSGTEFYFSPVKEENL